MSFIARRQRANLDPRVKDEDHWRNWPHRVVIIWEEDDATRGQDYERDGHEQSRHAFERIFRINVEVAGVIDKYDGGDIMMTLHSGGRVTGYSCEGGFVGVVAEMGLRVARGGDISGTLPCGHDAKRMEITRHEETGELHTYCAGCWNEEPGDIT